MEWRRRKVKDSEPETDACRIPHKLPGEGTVSSAVRVDKPPTDYGPSESTLIIAVLLCFTLLLLTPLWNLTYVLPASVSIRSTGAIQGQAGFDIRTENWAGSKDVILLNSTPFTGPPEWSASTSYSSDVLGEPENDGYHVDLHGPLGWHQVVFAYRLHVPLDDISKSNFEARISVISGMVNATLRVEFSEYRWGNLVMKDDMESIQAGGDTVLTVETPLPLLRTISEQWIVTANVYIFLESFTGAKVVINGFSAVAIGNVPLYPLVIDLQSTTNESLYDSPLTRSLMSPPYILMRRDDTLANATIWPERSNETIFIAEGNYTADVGWDCNGYYPEPFDSRRLELHILPDTKTLLQARMKAVRLDLVGFGLMPIERFEISYYNRYNDQYDIWHYTEPPIVLPDHVYVAPLPEPLLVHVTTADTLQNDPLTGYNGGSFYLDGDITTDGAHDLELAVAMPVIPVGGVFLGLGHILLMIIMGILMFLLYRKYREVKTIRDSRVLLRSPRIIPVLLLIVGGITPWYVYTNHLSGSIEFSTTMYYFVPVIIAVMVVADSSTIITIPFGWFFVLLIAGILYWYPLTKIVASMIAPQSPEKQSHYLRYLGMTTTLCVLTLALSMLASITPAIGVGLVLSALPVWIVQDRLEKPHKEGFLPVDRSAEGEEDE